MITIKTYEPRFAAMQASLGQRVTKTWNHYFQIREKKIQEIYSLENFDPTTRFYAFIGERFVGFVISAAEGDEIASMQFPMVDPGFPEVEEILVNKVVETMRNRGLKKLRIRLGNDADNIMSMKDFCVKYGFNKAEGTDDVRTRIFVDEIDCTNYSSDYTAIPFEFNRDFEGIVNLVVKTLSHNEVEVRDTIKSWERGTPGVTNLVVRADDRLLGHGMCLWDINNEGAVVAYHIKVLPGESNQIRDTILNAMIQDTKNRNIPEFLLYVPLDVEDPESLYTRLGLIFTQNNWYEKSLT
ncbi:MAG: hypothetical protein INQ03_14725 [Candidatus Heimdallarchaeota archaeon]|nr:hypothetical protein [Candidatus Heimdallarchaeota archaeon]